MHHEMRMQHQRKEKDKKLLFSSPKRPLNLCVLRVKGSLRLATVWVFIRNPVLVAFGNLVVAALPRDNLVDIHPVKLLERATLSFNDKEVNNADSHEKATSEDVSVGKVNLLGDKGCKETDEEVPQPVGGGS